MLAAVVGFVEFALVLLVVDGKRFDVAAFSIVVVIHSSNIKTDSEEYNITAESISQVRVRWGK